MIIFNSLKPVFTFLFTIVIGLVFTNSHAQNTPTWNIDINAYPDSSAVSPVGVVNQNNGITVLSTYHNRIDSLVWAVFLNHYSVNGDSLWSLKYWNTNSGHPQGYAIANDEKGNVYVAGTYIQGNKNKPMLLKNNSSGILVWDKDSSLNSKLGSYDQVIVKNNKIFVGGSGVACFDDNGNEMYSDKQGSTRIQVDKADRMILSGFDFSDYRIIRYDTNGNKTELDSQFNAGRIAIDSKNNIYVLSQYPKYELMKLDSNGQRQWSYDKFTMFPSFGDIAYDVLIDRFGDILLTGITDSVYKITPEGKLKWKRSMEGLDAYLSTPIVTNQNLLLIAGTVYENNEYNMKVAAFNQEGKINWYGSYSSNTGKQEYTRDMCINPSGYYVIENNQDHGSLVRFSPQMPNEVDFSLLCIDKVWYDTTNKNRINVSLFNGSASFISYPSIQIVAPNGDTIGNPLNAVNFFGIAPNSYQTHNDSINVINISDFSNYTFLFNIGFSDTTIKLKFCNSTKIKSKTSFDNLAAVYPNPFSNKLTIDLPIKTLGSYKFNLYDLNGLLILNHVIKESQTLTIENLNKGMYFYVLKTDSGQIQSGKLVSE
ncbi:MAG: T9SS type A sorting domain-containing protein [Bacteroidia bacterium]